MATITVTPTHLRVELTLGEKFGGLIRDLEIPVAAVRRVMVAPDGLAATRGVRAPGLAIPRTRNIGTWRRRGQKSFVSVRRGEPALVLDLVGARFDRVVVGSPQATAYADQLHELGVR